MFCGDLEKKITKGKNFKIKIQHFNLNSNSMLTFDHQTSSPTHDL